MSFVLGTASRSMLVSLCSTSGHERFTMIRVIDGFRYNTATAEPIFTWTNGHFVDDFKFRQKRLYLTKKGAWFIWHSGGALTDMAISVGNNGTCGSDDIEPIGDDDAYGFLQAHSDDKEALEAIDKYFADRVEDA